MFRNKDNQREAQPAPDAKNPKVPSKASPPSMTVIAPGARVSGELHTTGNVQVDGRIDGSVTADGNIQVGTKGNLEAEVTGHDITVAGSIKGKIYADGKVILLSGSRVEGDIHAQSLKIEDAVFFQGGCVMGEDARKRRSSETPLPKSIEKLKAA